MRLAMRVMTSSAILVVTVELAQRATELGVRDRSGVLVELREQIGRFPPVEPFHHQLGSPCATISSTFGTASKRRPRFWSRVASRWSMS